MIRAAFDYFSLLHRRSGRFYFDLTAMLVFAAIFLSESAKDYESTLLSVGVMGVCSCVWMMLRQFRPCWLADAAAVISRAAGRRAALAGALLSLAFYLALYLGALMLLSLLDGAMWHSHSLIEVFLSLIYLALAVGVAGMVLLHFTPLFAPLPGWGGWGISLLGVIVIALGLVSAFLDYHLSAEASFVIRHILPPLNPLIQYAMNPQLSLSALGEAAYSLVYGAIALAWAFYRWYRLDLIWKE